MARWMRRCSDAGGLAAVEVPLLFGVVANMDWQCVMAVHAHEDSEETIAVAGDGRRIKSKHGGMRSGRWKRSVA